MILGHITLKNWAYTYIVLLGQITLQLWGKNTENASQITLKPLVKLHCKSTWGCTVILRVSYNVILEGHWRRSMKHCKRSMKFREIPAKHDEFRDTLSHQGKIMTNTRTQQNMSNHLQLQKLQRKSRQKPRPDHLQLKLIGKSTPATTTATTSTTYGTK